MRRLRQGVAKWRIKRLEHQAFVLAGREIPPQLVKAQELRKKYGLQDWQYTPDY